MEAPAENPEAPGRRVRPSRRFVWALVLIAFAALTFRVVYTVAVTQGDPHIYDATYYELQARSIMDGDGFFHDPFLLFREHPIDQPAADHPPLTVLVLLPAAIVEGPHASELAMRITMALIGTASVVAIGLFTRSLAGEAAGLVAAVIAALDPNLWMNDGLIMSEALSALLTIAIVWCVYRVIRHGTTWRNALGLGLLVALGLLARAEFVLYVPFLAIPALWIGARRDHRRALGAIALSLGVVVVAVGPWVGYNLSRFDRLTTISTNDGLALRAANCDNTFYGPHIGWVDVFPPCAEPRNDQEQSVWNAQNRKDALHYIADHLDRVPVVALARLGRTFDVFHLGQSAYWASYEGRPEWATYLAAVATWCLLPLAAFGLVVLRRARTAVWPLVVPFATTIIAIAGWSGGLLRYRAPAEPTLVVLGAIGVVAVARRWRDRGRSTATRNDPGPTDPGPTDGVTAGATPPG